MYSMYYVGSIISLDLNPKEFRYLLMKIENAHEKPDNIASLG